MENNSKNDKNELFSHFDKNSWVHALIPTGVVVGCLISYHFINSLLGLPHWFLQILVFLIPSFTLTWMEDPSWFKKNCLDPFFEKGFWGTCLKLIVLTVVFSLILNFCGSIWQVYFPIKKHVHIFYQSIPWPKQLSDHPWMIFTFCIVPAVSEEWLFRGYYQTQLRKNFSTSKIIWLSALVFAVAHLNPTQLFFYLLLGAYFAWVYESEKKFIYVVIAHFVNNFSSLYLAPRIFG